MEIYLHWIEGRHHFSFHIMSGSILSIGPAFEQWMLFYLLVYFLKKRTKREERRETVSDVRTLDKHQCINRQLKSYLQESLYSVALIRTGRTKLEVLDITLANRSQNVRVILLEVHKETGG